jgi:hypothetical protein
LVVPPVDGTADIGHRARLIRRRRRLSLEGAAGLGAISTGFLSRLERAFHGLLTA